MANRQAIIKWIDTRKKTIRLLRETADKIQLHHRNVSAAKLGGNGLAVAGGIIAIVGLALTPATFGASASLIIAGTVIGAAGGVTGISATVADWIIEKCGVKSAQKQYNYDIEQLKEVLRCEKKSLTKPTRFEDVAVSGALILSKGTVSLVDTGFFIAKFAGKEVAKAGIVTSAIVIPIDLIDIVRNGCNVVSGGETKASKELRELASELERQMNNLKYHYSIT